VLGLVAAGMTCVRIARELYLSPRTVETHITSSYHKLGVNSRAAATCIAWSTTSPEMVSYFRPSATSLASCTSRWIWRLS
jgi:hypothetical protein